MKISHAPQSNQQQKSRLTINETPESICPDDKS
jgi:hypothetical protein